MLMQSSDAVIVGSNAVIVWRHLACQAVVTAGLQGLRLGSPHSMLPVGWQLHKAAGEASTQRR